MNINFKNSALAVIFWAGLAGNAFSQWSVAQLSAKREAAIPLVVGQKVLFAGGKGPGNAGKTVDVFDNPTGLWTTAQLPFSTEQWFGVSAVVLGKKAYIMAAGEDDIPSEIKVYDSETGGWSSIILPMARQGVVVGGIDRFVVFAGGHTPAAGVLTRVDIFDTEAQTWSLADLSEARALVSMGALGSKLFIAGGITNTDASGQVDIFDSQTGLWTTASLGSPRSMMSVVSVGNKLLFAGGGVLDFVFTQDVDIFDGDTGNWSTGKLNQWIFANSLRGVAAGGKAFFAGGKDPFDIVDVFDPATNTWDTLHSPSLHQLFPMVAIGDKVFLGGGLNNPAGQVDIFDAKTNTWTNAGNLSTWRYSGAGAAVGNKVLFAGGGNGWGGQESDVVDIYTDPTASAPEILPGTEVAVFPNPASEHAVFLFEKEVSGQLTLARVDGAIVFSKKLDGEQRLEIPVSELPSGIYFWKWAAGGRAVTGKVVVAQ